MLRRLLNALIVLAGVALATPAFSHASLMATDPATGEVLAEAPAVLTLTFNEPVNPTVLRLIMPDGQAIELSEPTLVGGVVSVAAPAMGEGTHVLSWRVVSDDGHPIGGIVIFSVGVVTGSGADAVQAQPAVRPAIWLVRLLLYFGLFIGAGGTFFVAWVAAPASLHSRPRNIMRAILAVGLAAVPLAFAVQGVDLIGGGLGDIVNPDAWSSALASTYTQTLVVAFVALGAGLLALAVPERARLFSVIAILGVGFALSLSGHASRAPPAALSALVVLIHTTTVAFWVGALIPLAFWLRGNGREGAAVLGRFSAVIPHAILPLSWRASC